MEVVAFFETSVSTKLHDVIFQKKLYCLITQL